MTIMLSASLGTTIAHAEVIGGANIRASFNGWLTPRTLPRSNLAPVSLHMKGTVRTSDGSEPPALKKVTIALNRHGKVSTKGLPLCRRSSIIATSTAQALAACHDALLGSGRFDAHIAIPTQAPFPARGQLFAFNSMRHDRHVILAHIFGMKPVPTSRVLILKFQRPGHGTFGTTLSMSLPEVAADWGHVTGFRLNLHRDYTYEGKQRSVINASCPAPKGFGSALFTAARGTYLLANGRQITRILTGTCRVRR
jgi:hypothetical protein